MRKVVGWSLTQLFSRSLAEASGHRSSSSWLVTKETSRWICGRTLSWGKTDCKVFWVSAMALTMARTVVFR